jgi:hypothetical protein
MVIVGLGLRIGLNSYLGETGRVRIRVMVMGRVRVMVRVGVRVGVRFRIRVKNLPRGRPKGVIVDPILLFSSHFFLLKERER